MSDNGGVSIPPTSGDDASVSGEEPAGDGVESVVLRRSPRYLRFVLVGVLVGVLIALAATFAFPANEEYTRLQTFGFLALVAAPVLALAGAVVALILDRQGRRIGVLIERETHRADEQAPAGSADAN